MNESVPKMRDFAQRLIAYEAEGNEASEAGGPEAYGGVVEKLRLPLVALSGTLGYRSLLSRALALANREARWLRAVHIKADGSLEYPAEMAQLDKKDIAEGERVLVGQLLGLLVTFIGEALTLRLLQDIWPAAVANHFDSGTPGSRKEET